MSFVINNKTVKKKLAEDTINRELLNKAISTMFNNAANNVIQSNKALAISIAGASNTLSLNGIRCNNITISNINQSASSNNTTLSQTNQSNIINMSSSITSSYDNNILKSFDIKKYTSKNIDLLTSLLKVDLSNIDISNIFSLSSQCGIIDIFNISNSCNNNAYDLNTLIKKVLDIDDSFKIIDNDNAEQTINNIISNQNFGLCLAASTANNTTDIKNILCNNFTLDKISQNAVTNLYMDCVFNQSNKTEILSSISSKILNRYNQIYNKIADLAVIKGLDYYNNACTIVDAFVNASIDKLAYDAGILSLPSPASSPKPTPIPKNTDIITSIMNYINDNYILLTISLSIIILLLYLK